METLRLVLLFVHIIGYAALLGGLLVQVRSEHQGRQPADARRDRHGVPRRPAARRGAEDLGSPDHAKIGVKFAVGLVILVLVMVNLRKPSIPQGLYSGLLALTVANIAVAVFWSPSTPEPGTVACATVHLPHRLGRS